MNTPPPLLVGGGETKPLSGAPCPRVPFTDLAGGRLDFRFVLSVELISCGLHGANGVKIRSFPAIHSIDGPVSFSLEWNGLKFVFGSDTYPNKWFMEYARDAGIAIHECFVAAPDLVRKMGFTPESALLVGTQVHTAPESNRRRRRGFANRHHA